MLASNLGRHAGLPRSSQPHTQQQKHQLAGPSRRPCRHRRCQPCRAAASAEPSIADKLDQARLAYEDGNRPRALKLFEQVMRQKASRDERQKAFYGATCIHASFGDVEIAQTTLRDGIDSGLDFEKALADESMLKMSAPTQVLVQLKRFASTRKRMRGTMAAAGVSQQSAEQAAFPSSRPGLQDAVKASRSEGGDMDTSPAAIAKRVAVVVGVLVLGGCVLFFVALRFAFPELI